MSLLTQVCVAVVGVGVGCLIGTPLLETDRGCKNWIQDWQYGGTAIFPKQDT